MDPDACFRSIIEALQEKEWEDCIVYCSNLFHWIECGGFLPLIALGEKNDINGFIRMVYSLAKFELAKDREV